MTVFAEDSHTSTHGAFGALAFGVGTSDVEHVLATQCLALRPMQRMRVQVNGELAAGLSAKDLVLHIIGVLGTAGATGHAIEFAGSAIRSLSMEGRMTLCSMAIEAGARVGLVAVDDKTIDYLRGRPHAPQGAQWDAAAAVVKAQAESQGMDKMLCGLDDIGMTLQKTDRIRAYEARQRQASPLAIFLTPFFQRGDRPCFNHAEPC